MFSKTNLTSTIITTIWGFFGGYLLWGVIGENLVANHMGTATGVIKEIPDYFHLAIGCLIVGFTFSSIYTKWAGGLHSAPNGLKFGLWIGLLMGLGNGLINFATTNIANITATFIDAGIYAIHFSIMGVLASLVYNKMTSSQ